MRIAVTTDPEIPVPPERYGGTERLVDLLVRGLVERGHEVTLFAHKDSKTPARLIGYPGRSSVAWRDVWANMRVVSSAVRRGPFDVVHSWGRLLYLLPVLGRSVPKIMSYGRWVTGRNVLVGRALSRGTLHFTAMSHDMIRSVRTYTDWSVIYPGVPLDRFRFSESVESDAPLVFLGRIEHCKGTHLAVEVAKRSGRPLVIAGNVEEEHRGYFEEKIKPAIDDRRVRYVGAVDDRQKNELLGRAAALLMPVLWREPFGIVMAEALACGTPVIGLKNGGSIPEVVEDGRTGFVCGDEDEMVEAVGKIGSIARTACRENAERRFSQSTFVGQYESLYERVR